MSQKALVIALDGATFDVLQPWIDAGQLPTLQALLQDGVHGTLTSTIPPVTPTAWSSFMTGKNPGKHGIYYFTRRDKASGREVPVNATLRGGKTLWELLSAQGKTVLVLNVPTTYPPHPVNGVMIADFLTPRGSRDFIFPQALVDEIEGRFGPYPLYSKTPIFSGNLSEATVEAFLQEIHDELAYKCQVAHFLIDRYHPDFTILHLWGTDRIQHELWNLFDPRHPKYDSTLGSKYYERIVAYFRAVDAEINRFKNSLDGQTSLFVISDHGFGPVRRFIDLNVWLLKEGYIAIKRDGLSRLKLLAWRLGLTFEGIFNVVLKSLFKRGVKLPDKAPIEGLEFAQDGRRQPLLSLNDIDWTRTKAYCKLGMGQIIINLEGREPHGCVKPGPEYEALRDEIVAKLRALRDPATGEQIEGHVHVQEDIYQGEYLGEAPDITFLSMENGYLAGNLLGFTTKEWITDTTFFSANHRMDGILIAEGKCLRKGARIGGARIIDLAPSLLYLMSQKIPSDMDGEVLREMFTDDFVGAHPIDLTDVPAHDGPETYGMSPDDEEDVIRRLRDLGYV